MATISEIQDLISKAKNGQKIVLKVDNQISNIEAKVADIHNKRIQMVDYANWFEGWPNQPVLKFRYFKLKVDAVMGTDETILTLYCKQLSKLEFLDSNGNYFRYPSGVTCSVYGNSKFIQTYTKAEGENPLQVLDHSLYTKLCDYIDLPSEYIYDMKSSCLDLETYNRWCWYTANDTTRHSNRNLKTFSLYVSNNGTDWIQCDSVTNYNATTKNYKLAYTGNISI